MRVTSGIILLLVFVSSSNKVLKNYQDEFVRNGFSLITRNEGPADCGTNQGCLFGDEATILAECDKHDCDLIQWCPADGAGLPSPSCHDRHSGRARACIYTGCSACTETSCDFNRDPNMIFGRVHPIGHWYTYFKADVRQVRYEILTSGKCTDVGSYIETEEECRAAAASVDWPVDDKFLVASRGDWPAGCWLNYVGNRVRFNTMSDSTEPCQNIDRCLCKVEYQEPVTYECSLNSRHHTLANLEFTWSGPPGLTFDLAHTTGDASDGVCSRAHNDCMRRFNRLAGAVVAGNGECVRGLNCDGVPDSDLHEYYQNFECIQKVTTKAPTTSPSPQPSPSPSTTEPTMGPTRAPTTSKPTFAPSDAPTTSKPTFAPSGAPTATPDASIFSATSEDECIHEIFDIGRIFGKDAHTIHVKLDMPEFSDPRQFILNLGQEGTGAHHWIWRGETVQFGSFNGPHIQKVDINSCTDLTTTFDGQNTLMLYCDGTFLGQIENSNLHIRNSKLAVAGNKLYEVPQGNFGGCVHHVEVWDYDLSSAQVASLTKGASIFSAASEDTCIHEVFDIERVFGKDAHTIHVKLDIPEYSDPRQFILNLGQEGTGANHWIWRGETIQFGTFNGPQIQEVDINSCTDLTTTFDGNHTLTLYCNGKFLGQIENSNLDIQNSILAVAGNQRYEVPRGNFGGCVHSVEVWDYDLSSRDVASLTKNAPEARSVGY